ncbi:MAG: NADH-quinone oxidoreductase subunit C [Thermoleophilia bacterium]
MSEARTSEAVPAAEWRTRMEAELRRGARFAGLFADHGRVRALWRDADRWRLLEVAAEQGHVPSVVAVVPAAGWDEREAADLGGITFDGHTPHRPLVHHPEDPLAWVTPVVGRTPTASPSAPSTPG